MDGRHHVATRREIIFIEVPTAGSPENARPVRPRQYRRNQLEPWRPALDIPRRLSKAERQARFLDAIRRQDEIVREHMQPDAALLRQRYGCAA
jgi:hypothetical protein